MGQKIEMELINKMKDNGFRLVSTHDKNKKSFGV